jgi:hypothetical protein
LSDGIHSAPVFEVVVETHFSLHADDFLMAFNTRLGGKWFVMKSHWLKVLLSVIGVNVRM